MSGRTDDDRSPVPSPGPSRPALVAMALAVAPRPDLWWAALGALRRLAAPGWWAYRPHLPLPDGELWAFRMVTAYGRSDQVPERADVISYLEWCRSTARSGGPRGDHGTPTPHRDRRDASRSG
jgi:hypothetical protein